MNKLYRFYLDCGRMGSLDGIFVEDDEVFKRAQEEDRYVSMHDVLGKHSEINIYFNANASAFKVLTDDQNFIEKAIEYGLIPVGTNPFDDVDFLEWGWEEE